MSRGGRGAFYKAKYGNGGRGRSAQLSSSQNDRNHSKTSSSDEGTETKLGANLDGFPNNPRQESALDEKGSEQDLASFLRSIDNQQYGRYQLLRGRYVIDKQCTLGIVHVQGDAYAPPSRMFFRIPLEVTGIPSELLRNSCRTVALADFFARRLCALIKNSGAADRAESNGWSGRKGGDIVVDQPSQCVLQRTNVQVLTQKGYVEARMGVGLPAKGRTVLGAWAQDILLTKIPTLCKQAFIWKQEFAEQATRHVLSVENQQALRAQLHKHNLVAFIANGSILPRLHGSSDLPLSKDKALPFVSPPSQQCSLPVPNGDQIEGMGISKGITVIVGGGYHGKTTLLQALERAVYDHIPGDGREGVVCDESAVKIRAEDGRSVQNLNISPFIDNLPFGRSTTQFSSEDASGSTSQAANIIEAIEMGTSLLLLDEDTCATNFMFRDEKMAALVSQDKEPIIPFLKRTEGLYTECGISTVLVVGSCGAYFDVAHTVLMLDSYKVCDVSSQAKAVSLSFNSLSTQITPAVASSSSLLSSSTNVSVHMSPLISSLSNIPRSNRAIDLNSLTPSGKVVVKDSKKICYGAPASSGSWLETDHYFTIDLSAVEQLVETGQAHAIADTLRYMSQQQMTHKSLRAILEEFETHLSAKGLDLISPNDRPCFGGYSRPRRLEVAAAINRWRGLRTLSTFLSKREREG